MNHVSPRNRLIAGAIIAAVATIAMGLFTNYYALSDRSASNPESYGTLPSTIYLAAGATTLIALVVFGAMIAMLWSRNDGESLWAWLICGAGTLGISLGIVAIYLLGTGISDVSRPAILNLIMYGLLVASPVLLLAAIVAAITRAAFGIYRTITRPRKG